MCYECDGLDEMTIPFLDATNATGRPLFCYKKRNIRATVRNLANLLTAVSLWMSRELRGVVNISISTTTAQP